MSEHFIPATGGRPRHGDGLPEFGSAEYAALPPDQQHAVCETRAGLASGVGDAFVIRPPAYTDAEPLPCPIDTWRN